MPRKDKGTTKRKRTIRGRLFRLVWKSTAAFLVVLAVAYAVAAIIYSTSGKVTIKRDFVAELNAPILAVPEEDRAWPLYREGYASLDYMPKYVREARRLDDHAWEQASEFLQSKSDGVDTLLAATAKPMAGYLLTTTIDRDDYIIWPEAEYDDDTHTGPSRFPLLDVGYKHVQVYRDVAMLLAFRANHAAHQGDTAAAIESVAAMLRLAKHASESKTMISQLVRVSIESLACRVVEDILVVTAQPLLDQDLIELQGLIRRQYPARLATIDYTEERFRMLDLEQRVYTDNGSGSGVFSSARTAELGHRSLQPNLPAGVNMLTEVPISVAMPRRKAFREMSDRFFRIIDERAALPLWERDDDPVMAFFLEIDRNPVSMWRWRLFSVMAPSVDAPLSIAERLTMVFAATDTVLAMHRYHAAQGDWPISLEALLPDYLDRVPIDRFDGNPLRYFIDDDGDPVLYSIGANYTDDHGACGYDNDGWPSNNETGRWRPRSNTNINHDRISGDYIFWPPLPVKPHDFELRYAD